MSRLFRVYESHELGPDSYPEVWHKGVPGECIADAIERLGRDCGLEFGQGVKHLVRAEHGHRCVRCQHPYLKGECVTEGTANWSYCDSRCSHGGPVRARVTSDRPWEARDDARPDQVALALALGNQVQARARILTTHHANMVKADLRPFNLLPLCQRCHLSVQSRVQLNRVWPWEHSEWFRPWAAAWYAQAYLEETLTIAEATERMDELLALERVA